VTKALMIDVTSDAIARVFVFFGGEPYPPT
jgi:hypothetical protein